MPGAARAWILGALLAGVALACGGDPVRRYPARGIVEDVNLEYGQVLIDHEDIDGLMPAMTMSFDVPDSELLARLEKNRQLSPERRAKRLFTQLEKEGEGDG